MREINWALIARLPQDGVIYSGGPEYGAMRVRNVPASKMRVAHLLAETGLGLFRRRYVPQNGKPTKLAQTEHISGSISE